MIRGSLAALMGVVALCALGLAALHSPTEGMASAVYTGLVAALLGGGFRAATSHGRRRRFWAMFAACGVTHFALTLLREPIPQLPTIRLVEWLHERYGADAPRSYTYIDANMIYHSLASDGTTLLHLRTGANLAVASIMPLPTFQIGVHLATLAVALLGGGLAALGPIGPAARADRAGAGT